MKIIELLNKIANKQQPNHIRFKNEDWYWGYDSYIPKDFLKHTPDTQLGVSLFDRYRIDYCLNDEIEIIEDNKIEKLNLDTDEILKNVIITAQDYVIEGKINEIIDKINEMSDKNE